MKKLLVLIVLLNVTSCGVNKEQIPLIQTDNNMLFIQVELNRVLKIPFLIDTGASDTSVPIQVFLTLKNTGTVVKEEMLESKIYTLADGSEVESPRFILKELKIGNKIFKNVEVSISLSSKAPLLLGENILSQFGKVEIDYKKSKLIVR